MTSTPVEAAPGQNRSRIPRPLISLIFVAAVLIVGALFHWAAERPTRPEFWPFVITLAIALGLFTYFRPLPYLTYNERPIEPVGAALFWTVVWGVIEGSVFWALSYLAWSDNRYWGIALMMGVLGATNRYFHGRHSRGRNRAQILAIVIVLLLMIAAKYAARH